MKSGSALFLSSVLAVMETTHVDRRHGRSEMMENGCFSPLPFRTDHCYGLIAMSDVGCLCHDESQTLFYPATHSCRIRVGLYPAKCSMYRCSHNELFGLLTPRACVCVLCWHQSHSDLRRDVVTARYHQGAAAIDRCFSKWSRIAPRC